MAPATIELVMWKGSQFSHKAVAALKVKGLVPGRDYKVTAGPDVRNYKEMVRLLPPPYTIPVLKWDHDVISGSDHICAWLDAKIPEPPLYPADVTSLGVSDVEQRCASMYWQNGFLSMFDPAGFDRFAGESVRQYTRKQYAIARPILALAPRTAWKIIHSVVRKDFVATMRRRKAPLAEERSIDVVYEQARAELASLDALLEASATAYFGGARSPTAADLTLYAMLERWVGDSMQPGVHGPAQPAILDGLSATRRMFDEVKAAYAVNLTTDVGAYEELSAPLGDATWPAPAEVPVDVKAAT